ncbi:FkbM family methyltransferase [Sulfitobacter sp. JL08]|uniref:FkbM family methyltransferase n=1 Tax=unclassified Sulfitobacter TaxID=196795 RepID=UPI0013B46AB0|nr:FkbM family methyltransferase [Sulfitobacter sp. JL08]
MEKQHKVEQMGKDALAPVENGLRAAEQIKLRFKRVPRGMIQVGAHNGREVRHLARSGVERGVFIDPLDETFPMLQKRVDQHSGYRAIQALVGDVDGQEVDFRIASNSGESSSILEPGSHTTVKPKIAFETTRRMTLRTLDVLLPEHGLDASDYDLLFVDTQGAEVHVLRGAMATLAKMDFVFLEVNIGGMYKGDTPLPELSIFMKTLGFEIAWCDVKHLGWGDALFVRRNLFAV